MTFADARNDVGKNYAPIVKRSGPLDFFQTTGATASDFSTLTLTITVDDLRKAHLRDNVDINGWHSIASMVGVGVKFVGGPRWQVIFAPFDLPRVAAFGKGSVSPPPGGCAAHDPASGQWATQEADYANDTVTFVLDTACLPDGVTAGRLLGHTSWSTKHGDFFDSSRRNSSPYTQVYSKPFRVAPDPESTP